MEVPFAIAAAAYLAHQYVTQTTPAPDVFTTEGRPLNPEELWMTEYQNNGALAPVTGRPTTQSPLSETDNIMFFHKPGTSNMENPVTNTYIQLLNGAYVERRDLNMSAMAHRPQYPRKSDTPLWGAFTPELHLTDSLTGEDLSTGYQRMSWLPKDATDSDWNDMALLAHVAPPNPLLFTPDANFMTAPGVGWRYAPV